MSFDFLNEFTADELYQKALEFEAQNDINNLFIYMTAAADRNHELANKYLYRDYYIICNHKDQDYSITRYFYEQNCDKSYSCNYYGWMHGMGCTYDAIKRDRNISNKLYLKAAKMGNIVAIDNISNMKINHDDIMIIYNNIPKPIEKNIKYFFLRNLNLNHNNVNDEEVQKIISYGGVSMVYELLDDSPIVKYIMENIKIKKELSILQKKYDDLVMHVKASPDGELFLEAYNEWMNKI